MKDTDIIILGIIGLSALGLLGKKKTTQETTQKKEKPSCYEECMKVLNNPQVCHGLCGTTEAREEQSKSEKFKECMEQCYLGPDVCFQVCMEAVYGQNPSYIIYKPRPKPEPIQIQPIRPIGGGLRYAF